MNRPPILSPSSILHSQGFLSEETPSGHITSKSMNIFSPEDLHHIDRKKVPTHIAIIPDGNRRWAKKQQLPSQQGHIAGANAIIRIVKAAKELGVKTVSLFAFSTENWKREKVETEYL